mgnify:CR=1 FL=1
MIWGSVYCVDIFHFLSLIMDPVVEGRVDYSKGNRLLTGEAFRKIPKIRYFGNSALSLLQILREFSAIFADEDSFRVLAHCGFTGRIHSHSQKRPAHH